MPALSRLLEQTSRTFALSIPRLPTPTDHEATVAYLLMRLADSFEDTPGVPPATRIDGLQAFCRLMRDPLDPIALSDMSEAGCALEQATEGERQLFDHCAGLLDAYALLRPRARAVIGETCREMAEGMMRWLGRVGPDGVLRLRDLDDLRGYCYPVAGTVGEMLTELFVLERPELEAVTPALRARAAAFGEGVQLVNILKDADADAEAGRVFLPPAVPRAQVIELARQQMGVARQYVTLLREAGAPAGVVAFNHITVELAFAALDVIEARGAGAKISRGAVAEILQAAG